MNRVIQIGNITPPTKSRRDNPNRGRVYDVNGISPCLDSMNGGGQTATYHRKRA